MRGLVCVFVVLAVLAARPAAATPVGDPNAVGTSGELGGTAEEDDVYYIPAEIFL